MPELDQTIYSLGKDVDRLRTALEQAERERDKYEEYWQSAEKETLERDNEVLHWQTEAEKAQLQRDEARGLLRRNHSVLCWLTWLDPVAEDREGDEIRAKQKQAAEIMKENDALLRGGGD